MVDVAAQVLNTADSETDLLNEATATNWSHTCTYWAMPTCMDLFTLVVPAAATDRLDEEDTLTPPSLDTHLNNKSNSFLWFTNCLYFLSAFSSIVLMEVSVCRVR